MARLPYQIDYGPLRWLGVASPDLLEAEGQSEEHVERVYAVIEDMEESLPELSRQYAEVAFVYVEAWCHGGTCTYEGYVCQNGRITERAAGDGALTRLVAHLGVELGDNEYFLPLQRGFFDDGEVKTL